MTRQVSESIAIQSLQKAVEHLQIDFPSLIAEVALWVHPSVHKSHVTDENCTGAVRPDVRRARFESGERRLCQVDGIILDDNRYANTALRAALGLRQRRGDGYQACHIWPGTCYDARYHTVLANLVLVPAPLVGLTDFDEGVIAALKYRSFELYRWHPIDEPPPQLPSRYPDSWLPPELPPEVRAAAKRPPILSR